MKSLGVCFFMHSLKCFGFIFLSFFTLNQVDNFQGFTIKVEFKYLKKTQTLMCNSRLTCNVHSPSPRDGLVLLVDRWTNGKLVM